MKIFTNIGEISFSTDPKDIGVINKNRYFHDFVAKGNVYTKIVKKGTKSLESQIVTADVLETYIPIIKNDKFIGAFEIYYDITAQKEKFDKLLHISSLVLILLAISLQGTIVIVLIKAGKNIVERGKTAAALQKSEERFRNLFEQSNDAVIIHVAGKILDVNSRTCEMIGYNKDKLITMKILDFVPEEIQKEVVTRMETEQRLGSLRFESKYIGIDGKVIDVEGSSRIIDPEKRIIQVIIRDISDRKLAEKEREKLINDLRVALTEVKTLRGFLPICSHCKNIRDDTGYWHQIESYIHKHSDAEFSHGICPECAKKYYPDIDLYEDAK
ncbi:PAS domain-containing protein [Thermodesulfobacteriota bacterium]